MQFIMNALRELSPDNIAMLSRTFLPHIASANAAAGQSAIAGLKRSQARRGLGGSNIALTQEAGLRGQLANAANTAAFQQGMGLAGQRAGVWGQMPTMTTPNMNMTNAFMAAVQQGLLANALAGKRGGGIGMNERVKYDPSGPSWAIPGWQPTPNWGLPPGYPEPPLLPPGSGY